MTSDSTAQSNNKKHKRKSCSENVFGYLFGLGVSQFKKSSTSFAIVKIKVIVALLH